MYWKFFHFGDDEEKFPPCKVASGTQSAGGEDRRVRLRSSFLQGCLRLMVISFPGTVSSACQFSDAAVRLDSMSAAKSQAVGTDQECEPCAAPKSRKSDDEEFDAVLSMMITGIVPQVQPPVVASPTEMSFTSDSVATAAGEITSSIGFGTTASPTGITTSLGVTSPSAESQLGANIAKNFPIAVPAGLVNLESSTSTAIVATQSLNGAATPIQSQAVLGSENQRTHEVLPSSASSLGTAGATLSEVEPSAFNLPVVTKSGLSTIPAALSQDAIDALELIGRWPSSVIASRPSSALFENMSAISGSRVQALSTFTLPVSLSQVPNSATQSSVLTELNTLNSATQSSVLTELNTLNAAVLGSKPDASLSVLPVSALPVATTPAVVASSVVALPVINPSVTNTSVTETVEQDATGNIKSAAEGSLDQVLATESKSVVQTSTGVVASKPVEPMRKPVRSGTSGASALPVLDNLEPLRGSESSAVSLSSDAVRNDMVQAHAVNSLPNLASSVSGEMRQPLSNQVSQAILEHLDSNGLRSHDNLSVRLDPPELGEMTIELSKTSEGLAVRVTAREAVTMDMLFARGQEIETQLRGQQMNLKSLEFLRADMSGNQFSQGQQQHEGSRRSENMMNQIRRGSRSSIPAHTNVGRSTTPDSTYGLSFRA